MNKCNKKRVLAVLGPTASGKTVLALDIATYFNCEIVNCDSRQIYQEMDIGTAKPDEKEQKIVPHHLFDIISPDKPFSAADYADMAADKIREIWKRNRLPLLTGGTGFYYDALSEGIGNAGSNQQLAKELREELTKIGLPEMLNKLIRLDSAAPKQIDIKNSRRVLRALEIVINTGKPLDENKKISVLPEAEFFPIVITRPRDQLHESIEKRIHKMLDTGLETEVKTLYNRYGNVADGLKSIGYREWFEYFKGNISINEVVEAIAIHTRQYAKRQETWFRRRPGSAPYDASLPMIKEKIFTDIGFFLLK